MEHIKLICFDLNKTLIEEDSSLNLNLAMGMTLEEDLALVKEYEAGRLPYQEWTEKIVQLYKGRGKATRENIIRAIYNYTYKPGAQETVKYLQEKGYAVSLISGAMDILVERIARELAIPYWAANNTFVFDQHGYLETIISQDDEPRAKVSHLKEICEMLNIPITECVAVGNGDNDLLLFQETKHGITFKNSLIKDHAWEAINNLGDIKNIF